MWSLPYQSGQSQTRVTKQIRVHSVHLLHWTDYVCVKVISKQKFTSLNTKAKEEAEFPRHSSVVSANDGQLYAKQFTNHHTYADTQR